MVFRAEVFREFIRHHLYDTVADFMAELVVELLEAVYIRDHDTDLFLFRLLVEAVELRPVLQSGQEIMRRGMGKGCCLFGVILQDFVIDVSQVAHLIAADNRQRFPLVQVLHTPLDRRDDQCPVHDQCYHGDEHEQEDQDLLAAHDLFDLRGGLHGAVFSLLGGDAMAVIHGIRDGGAQGEVFL